ncbi:GTP cyclohydrolase II [Subtercola endophyticus]|uniref:GTP cyclohydrolase II n=1 Tax=Subtercola endophyticus TaxID=2895559 RepID=UPI001E51017B|nr:GTP cyclohydrolase II [Subtercola endophyticus]UFS57801.1 GTP cyclohydrolase II [Subtercola endophyticus]
MALTPMPEVLAALRAGKPVIVADDETRENEGDAILAAELATPEWIAWMVRNTSGFLCAPMTPPRAAALGLPPMVERNEDSLRTAYTITVDASEGVTTGISAADRAHTLRSLADPASTPASFIRPGHVLPVVAVEGGVRRRGGHTEATTDLLTLAGLTPVGVIGEIVLDNGSMARMPDLIALGERDGLPVTTIAALIVWLDAADEAARVPSAAPDAAAASPAATAPSAAALQPSVAPTPAAAAPAETATTAASAAASNPAAAATGAPSALPGIADRVQFQVETVVPTIHGAFRFRAYHDLVTGADHLAVISGTPPTADALVRVHSECLTGEAFGSLKCECGPQLDASLDLIARHGGVVVYLRGQEGRGIGLINKLRAYRLQEDGLDTLDANLALGLAVDSRDYTAAAAILVDLGIESVRLLTNNPDKVSQLEAHGIAVTKREPLIVGHTEANAAYLETKRDRMGHLFPVNAG